MAGYSPFRMRWEFATAGVLPTGATVLLTVLLIEEGQYDAISVVCIAIMGVVALTCWGVVAHDGYRWLRRRRKPPG